MALIRHAEQAPRTIRLHGVAYTAGVLSCFAVLAGLLIALKAGGEAAGWGFQLQSPAFVAVMAYLFFLLGLNLSGFFEIGGAVGIGSGLAARGGYSGSYFTGVLAAVVSTPCTAPFMGVALGFALTQPAPVSLAVFLALGVGFALPYLLLTFVPALVRLLPRPGAWMERTRQFLAFPLYASAAWLVWVLSIQTGPDGVLAALAGMVLIAFGLWLWNVVRDAGPRGRLLGRSGTAAAAVAALALVAGLGIASAPTAPQPASGQSASGPKYERFSSERLATLRAGGKPVFVNMTAAWCITCLVNERVALSSAAVTEQFEAQGITYLKGDWTNGDPEITALLESFGRSGVPLYVLYGPGSSAPTLLPQLLTETLVLDALRDLSGKTKLTDRSNRRSS
jgi:thiol:disulfide interchange protein DsbD